jgi:hypothetical protein
MNPDERKVKQIIMDEICKKMEKFNISMYELQEYYEAKEAKI